MVSQQSHGVPAAAALRSCDQREQKGRPADMSLHDVHINRLDGTPGRLGDLTQRRPALIVNVASRCGHTPQYDELEALHRRYSPRGFTVVGVPCNQFGDEEPGSPEQIAEFCSTHYGITFPLTEKVRVNGKRRHPLYAAAVASTGEDGHSGDVRWNFEKFLVDAEGVVVARFAPGVNPDDFRVAEAIDELLD
jgi:glutathione peroxidase